MPYYLTKDEKTFGVPQQKKFPLPDADHVRSAIKFFNYVEPKYEQQLARAILRRAKEYGVDISEMSIGDNNRFKKYLPNTELKHHGIIGMKWGIRRYQNPDGTYTAAGKKRRLSYYLYKNDRKSENKIVNRLIEKNKSTIAKEISKGMVDDIKRWAKEGDKKSQTLLKNKKLQEEFEKKVNNNMNNRNKDDVFVYFNGVMQFTLDGFNEYQEAQPLRVEYNPKTKEVYFDYL